MRLTSDMLLMEEFLGSEVLKEQDGMNMLHEDVCHVFATFPGVGHTYR